MLERRRGRCGACGGTLSLRYGQQFKGQKKPKILYTVALDGRWLINLHTTTNQKQAPIMEESRETSEDAIWDLQEINFMGVMSKNTPIKLILLIRLCIDCDQINFVGKK
jgi:hypothetical protein